MSNDVCLNGLSRNVEVSQLHLRGRKKEREFVEAGDVGKAWTVVSPEVLKEWNR